MVMQRWNPMSEFERMWDEMDRMFTDAFRRGQAGPRTWTLRPPIDVYDSGEQLVVRAAVPGAQPEDIDIAIEQNTLSIRGRVGYTLPEEERERATWYQRGIASGEFSETITLPVPVDTERAQASFEHGILTLTLPKAAEARVRRIPVRAEQPALNQPTS